MKFRFNAAAMRPSLVGRVMLALLIAFILVWLVLLAKDVHSATDRDAFDSRLRAVGDQLLTVVAPLDKPGEARAAIAASMELINATYRANTVPGALMMALSDASGARVFLSEPAAGAIPAAPAGQIGAAVAKGLQYRVFVGQRKRWSLLVAAPVMPAPWLLARLGGALTVDMLIALPFVLLPLWFAVRGALAPLRKLSRQIATRSSDDLSALVAVPTQAELQPLVSALDRLLRQMRQKLAREQAFVHDAAHELRTPMAVLAAQAHVLALASDDEQRASAGHSMQQALGRASHLISQLLMLARMEHASGPANHGERTRFDAAQLLRRELAALAPRALEQGIDLSLDAPEQLMVNLNMEPFITIIHNLLNNAVAYVPAQAQVRVRLQADGTTLLLKVADNGPGIALDQRALVFERFYRGREQAQLAPGAGLGLAIVREASLRLGGTVALDGGIDGAGCTFTVTIEQTA
jgi:signal transduction histidine kinase